MDDERAVGLDVEGESGVETVGECHEIEVIGGVVGEFDARGGPAVVVRIEERREHAGRNDGAGSALEVGGGEATGEGEEHEGKRDEGALHGHCL